MIRVGFRSMGCEVVVGGARRAELRAIRALFQRRDRMFSRFRADSELVRVNAARAELVPVLPEFALLLDLALDAARATGGSVTPTVGGAVLEAGYDRDFGLLARDDPRPPAPAAPVLSWRDVQLFGPIVRRPPGLQLDLNGVVKGATVDDALELLDGEGFVSAGGDLAARGPVVVGVPGGEAVTVEAAGLATSSTALRRWRRAGSLQHHLIDPTTGAPSTSPWTSVTVAAASCLAADVAAKAALLKGPAGPDWLERRSAPGRFVDAAGRVAATGAWRRGIERAAA